MKRTKHRLILPMQAKGNMGKSIEATARACWLNQRGIQWQGFDLDGDNRTLSRLFPSQVKLAPLNGQAEDLDELILILRKTTAQPVTLIDPRAHLDAQLMKALAATHFFDIASAQDIGITLMVFPFDDLDVMTNLAAVCQFLRPAGGLRHRPQSGPCAQNADVRRQPAGKGIARLRGCDHHRAGAVRICEIPTGEAGGRAATRHPVQ